MGKILLLSFKDNEEEMINTILSALNTGRTNYNVEEQTSLSEINAKDLLISLETREVMRRNEKIKLTYTEFEILQLMASNPGKVFSKEQIYDIVWKEPYDGDYNIVTSHIRHIREKIEDEPVKPIYIQTVWGVGYRFNKNLSSGL